jgi:hypothetical protein
MKALRLLSPAQYAAADPGGRAGRVPTERRRTAMEYIAFDAHKRYTQVSVETADGERRYDTPKREASTGTDRRLVLLHTYS